MIDPFQKLPSKSLRESSSSEDDDEEGQGGNQVMAETVVDMEMQTESAKPHASELSYFEPKGSEQVIL